MANILNTLTLIFLFFSQSLLAQQASHQDLKEISELIAAGSYEEALHKQLKFHEDSRTTEGFGAVRLSYGITTWLALGELYAPALDALKLVRDQQLTSLRSGKGNSEQFHEVSSINQRLGQSIQTLELFKFIDQHYPKQAELYFIMIEQQLYEGKEYKLLGKYIDDPIYRYENLRHNREIDLHFAKTYPNKNKTMMVQSADKSYILGVKRLLELMTVLNKHEEKAEVLVRASTYFGYQQIVVQAKAVAEISVN